MQARENLKNDDFTSQIENAIDNLFSAKREIVIDPSTNEVIEQEDIGQKSGLRSLPSQQGAVQKKVAVTRPSSGAGPGKRIEEDPTILLEKLNQSFLTIDWEISEQNIDSFRDLLNQLQSVLSRPTDSDEGLVMQLMEQLLTSMAKSPSNVPPSATQALQKGLVYIQEVIDRPPQEKGDVAELTAATLTALRNSLPTGKTVELEEKEDENLYDDLDLGDLEEAIEEEGVVGEILESNLIPTISDFRLPIEISNAINLHLSLLAQCINHILPLEEQFSRSTRLHKLLAIHQEIRVQLEEQKDRLSTALGADYSSANLIPETQIPEPLGDALQEHIQGLRECAGRMNAVEKSFQKTKGYEKLYKVAKELREQFEERKKSLSLLLRQQREEKETKEQEMVQEGLVDVFRSHVPALDKCIKQIIPIENLFAGRQGYEKLLAVHQKLRMQLESQKEMLSDALQGDFITIPAPPAEEAPVLEARKTCPWENLAKGQWRGKSTAFVPEQIAYQRPAPNWAKKMYQEGATHIPLSKLKCWPWSKIAPLFSGDLATIGEKELQALRLPIINPPSQYIPTERHTGEETLLILYKNKQGGILLLDRPTEEFTALEEHAWEPFDVRRDFLIEGYLSTDLDTIAVINIEKGHWEGDADQS